jgi:hypothetical protein
MPFIPVVDVVEVEVVGSKATKNVENTFYYKFPGVINQSDIDALTAAVASVVLANFVPQLPSDWVGVEVHARDLTSNIAVQSSDVSIAGAAGTVTGTPLPNNASFALKRVSGLTGRSARGRIYWMGLSDAQTSAPNVVGAPTAVALAGVLDTLDAAITLLGWQPVIVSKFTGGVARGAGVTFPIIHWLFTDLRVDTMRERMS